MTVGIIRRLKVKHACLYVANKIMFTCWLNWGHMKLEGCRSNKLWTRKLYSMVQNMDKKCTDCNYPTPSSFRVIMPAQKSSRLYLCCSGCCLTCFFRWCSTREQRPTLGSWQRRHHSMKNVCETLLLLDLAYFYHLLFHDVSNKNQIQFHIGLFIQVNHISINALGPWK